MSAPVPDWKSAAQRAARELEWLRAHRDAPREAWREHLRAYVLERFLLEADEPEDDLLRLAQKSVERLTGIPREALAAADRPSGCAAATAAVDKKVLLLLSLRKGLGVSLPPEQAPGIKGIRQLADALYERVNEL